MGFKEENFQHAVVSALKEVFDPEMPSINILDLGLVYYLDTNVDSGHVHVKHTLTSMMCPFADEICRDITEHIQAVEGVKSIDRELVFDPPFSMEMVPEETKIIMGWI